MVTSRQLKHLASNPVSVIRATPTRIRLRRTKGKVDHNATAFARDSRPGEVTRTFEQIRSIPGWFTIDDAAHFTLILRLQSMYGIKGDVLEIGSYHGRSTAVIAGCLNDGERLTVCDPFQTGEVYIVNPPSAKGLRRNVGRVNPGLSPEALEIIPAYSTDLHLDEGRRFRFIHIDGSHEAPDVLHDLNLAIKHLLPGGIIACDDHDHPDWPGVTEAIRTFRAEHPELLEEVADLNRYAESGRKLYLMLPRS